MAMRVTQRTMYNSMLNNMQSTLGAYMESNIQGSSQKRINRPSDDPAGMALVLNSRRSIQNNEQYQSNVDTAKGWLKMTDSVLQQTSTTIIKIKELAEQASTETYTHENRQQIASELRQLFGQLVNLSNSEFESKTLFAGHKYNESAFDQVLTVSSMDEDVKDVKFTVDGQSEKSYMLIFGANGTVGQDALDYRWSNDNGKTWHEERLAAGDNSITMDGVTLNIPNNTTVKAEDPNADISGQLNGTVLYVHPNARYNGDEQGAEPHGVVRGGQQGLMADIKGKFDKPVMFRVTTAVDLADPGATVTYEYSTNNGANWQGGTTRVPNPTKNEVQINLPDLGGSVTLRATGNPNIPINTFVDIQPRRVDMLGGIDGLQTNVQGTFNNNVMVRIDTTADLTVAGTPLEYSYSTDNGASWVKASTATPTPAASNIRLPLPSGFMEITSPNGAANNTLAAGTQFVIHPDRADLNYEIMKDSYVAVNNVGKDIFGGVYNGEPSVPNEENLFDIVGSLVTYCDFNNRQGIADALTKLTAAQERIMTADAAIGGLQNRITLAKDVLGMQKEQQEGRLSYVEDMDLTKLLTQMAQQEMAYNTVLKSSSMIMQLNLTKYI